MTAGQISLSAEELCAAAARALSGEPRLHFRGGELYRGRARVPMAAGHLRPEAGEDAGSVRGAADGIALRLLRSDARLHARLAPEDPTRRLLFELLEQFRVESLAPEEMPGVRANLRLRHERWSLGLCEDGLTGSARGLLLYTVLQVCRARITGEPVVAATEGLIEAPRAAIAPPLGGWLAGLRRCRADQEAFAAEASALAEAVAGMLDAAGPVAEAGEGGGGSPPSRFLLLAGAEPAEPAEPADAGGEGEQGGAVGGAVGAHRPGGAADAYRVFTTAYDRECTGRDLARPELLREYRLRLDRLIAEQGVNTTRLTRELRALLARPDRGGWESGCEEGRLDGRLLTRLVTAPTDRRLFRRTRQEPAVDALVTFLVDCSGSMKRHREPLAVLVDSFARALELAGASCEILGFTTGAWNGGRARRDWLRSGRPPGPGRLNERLHLVLKPADTPWRRARPDIAALLRPDHYREGVDGEALQWACERARQWPARRRIVIALSDGSPMDTATLSADGEGYLDRHLCEVADREERAGAVELRGAGVGLDLSRYYRRSRILDFSGGTGHALFRQVCGLLEG